MLLLYPKGDNTFPAYLYTAIVSKNLFSILQFNVHILYFIISSISSEFSFWVLLSLIIKS